MALRTAASSIWTPGRSPVKISIEWGGETGAFDGEFVDGDDFARRGRQGLREEETCEDRKGHSNILSFQW